MIPKLVAHRGYAKRYPENTLPSIQAAVTAGACYIEFDIQFSKDLKPVLIHDDNLTRVSGLALKVVELLEEELVGISVHEPDRLGNDHVGVLLPSLATIVKQMPSWAPTQFLVEIKTESIEYFGREQIKRHLFEILDPVLGQCILISYDLEILKLFKDYRLCKTGFVITQWGQDELDKAAAASVEYFICNYTKIPQSFVRFGDYPWQWVAYEIIDPALALALAASGIQMIETMNIKEMLQHPELSRGACH